MPADPKDHLSFINSTAVHQSQISVSNIKGYGSALSSTDIANELNNPDSQLKKDAVIAVSRDFFNTQFKKQQTLLAWLQELFKEMVENGHTRPGITTAEIDFAEKVQVPAVQQLLNQNQDLLKEYEKEIKKLMDLYKTYSLLRTQLKGSKVNTAINSINFGPEIDPSQFEITEEKHEELNRVYEKTEKNFEKVPEIIGRDLTPEDEPHKNMVHEMKFLHTILGPHYENPVFMLLLIKQGIYKAYIDTQEQFLELLEKLGVCRNDITATEARRDELAQNIKQNAQDSSNILRPQFSQALNSEELLKKLMETYEVYKRRRMVGGFESAVTTQLKQMSVVEKDNFFKQLNHVQPKNDDERNIMEIVNDIGRSFGNTPRLGAWK